MRPGQVHELKLKAGSIGYLLQFKKAFFSSNERSLRKATHPNFYKLGISSFKKVADLLESILQEYNNKQADYREAIKANLDILFIELSRQQNSSASNSTNQYTQERLEEFLSLVEKHIATYKQPSQYANLLNLSLHQLNMTTKSLLGRTASALINEHIILESKRWLLATSAQVKEIACELGYEDVSYFVRSFKKHTGQSPDAFRQHFK
jgi:YesN/AraC family two-component response regulator